MDWGLRNFSCFMLLSLSSTVIFGGCFMLYGAALRVYAVGQECTTFYEGPFTAVQHCKCIIDSVPVNARDA